MLVWNDADNLYVRYIVDDPWCLTETHLHVATSLALIPQKNNNPVPGQFEFMHPLSCVQQDQFVIPLASFDGTELFIAAHAVEAREIMFGIFQYKTAWGAGSRFSNKNWATYFIYIVQEIVIPGSIGDFVWNDSNGNGIQDAGEPGVPGVTVKLRDCASVVLATTITDANGLYQFSNLLPDDYLIEFVAPAGYVFTVASAPGSTPVNDSNADSNGKTLCTTLSSGENNNTLDAGLIQPA